MLRKLSFAPYFKSRLTNYIALLLTTLVFLVCFTLLDSKLKIQKVYVSSKETDSAVLGLYDLQSENIIFLSTESIEKSLLEKNPFLKTISVKKIYPNELYIVLNTYNPIAAFKVNEGYFILSEDARILAKSKNIRDDLSLIQYYQLFDYYTYQAGDLLNYKDVVKTLFFLKALKDFGFPAERIDINSLSMIVFNLQEAQIYLSAEKETEKQLFEFENIIKRFRIEGKKFKSLDLRFDKPIVKF